MIVACCYFLNHLISRRITCERLTSLVFLTINEPLSLRLSLARLSLQQQAVDANTEESTFKNVAICVMTFAALYLVWTAALWINVAAVARESVSEPFRWLFTLSSFTLLVTVVGLFVGIAYSVPASAFVFIGFVN